MFKDNYQLLIERLDQFIRKYYVNQLIRGSLYTVGVVLGAFVFFNVLEYYLYLGTTLRKLLFYSFIGLSLYSLITWIVLPIVHYYRLGKVISHEQAAKIIGDHFVDVKDKLINILQLKQQSFSSSQADLINASINQKSEQLKPVPFKAAIDFASNKKYIKYALPPLLLLLIILFAAPSIIKEGSKRLINNNKIYEKEAPFKFVVNKENLKVVQFEDYDLKVKIDGEVLPNEVFVNIDNVQYRLTKEQPNLFTYKFANVQKTTDFQLYAGGFRSEGYQLDVLAKPNIAGFQLHLDYPDYTERKDESLNNVGDIVVPAGTNIKWDFDAQHTDNLKVKFGENGQFDQAKRVGENYFSFNRKAMSDERYKVFISNAHLPNGDSIGYSITVIPDMYPSISVQPFIDSTNNKVIFFAGDISDDYGFRNLSFNYSIKGSSGKETSKNSLKLQLPTGKQGQYKYTFDVNLLNLAQGDEVSYYFEVVDNDAVHGGKPSKTNSMTFKMPTKEELQQQAAKNNDEIKKDLESAMKESKKIQEDLKKIREKLLQQKEPDWQTKKDLEKLLNRQKELDKQIEEAKKNFEENKKNETQNQDEKKQDKQENMEKIFDQLQDEEMKKLMQQIEELMQKMDKDQALEKLEKFEQKNEEQKMEMDRMKELFKKLELEQKKDEAIEKLEELAKKEEQLSKDSENNQKSQEELKKDQNEIKKEFNQLQEKMRDIEKKSKELEKPKDPGTDKEQEKEIEKDMEESKDQLDQKQNSKASKSQKKAASKMKNMANKMKSDQESAEMDQMEEDMKAMRQLLENIVNLSFDQEKLMNNFSKTAIATPTFVSLIQQQHKLKDNFMLIQDSLQALSKRVYQIEAFVTEKVMEINANMNESIEKLEDVMSPANNQLRVVQEPASSHQQKVMKNANDLALMLSESMEEMQKQMGESMPGNQSCNKPGGKNPKPGKGGKPKDVMSEGQKKLGEDMKKMKEGQKGGQPGMGGQDAKSFAEMAARQAAMRKALRELQKENQQKGKGSKELQDIIDGMDKVETDLVNKRLTNETIKRVDDIQVKLLESERAEREREYDEKRKGETAKDYERKMPPSLQEYLKKREAEIELYKTVSPNLKPFYKNLVEEYVKTLKKG